MYTQADFYSAVIDRKLKFIILREISPSQKDKYQCSIACFFPLRSESRLKYVWHDAKLGGAHLNSSTWEAEAGVSLRVTKLVSIVSSWTSSLTPSIYTYLQNIYTFIPFTGSYYFV